jgi:CRISPR-associated endonuclease Cas3-HD
MEMPRAEWTRERGFFAHSVDDRDTSTWEPLQSHLERVASLAATFAAAFSAQDWGYLAGLWHDLGKFNPDFQRRLFGEAIQVEHAGAGAALACHDATPTDPGLALAFAIAGHHAGLANCVSSSQGSITPLRNRLDKNRCLLAELKADVPMEVW